MKLSATIAGLLIAMSASLPASAAIALESESPPVLKAAATPVASVRHRHARMAHHRAVAPSERDDGHGAYGFRSSRMNSSGIYDWSRWSPTHHPGWPCISGEESATSAYPSWEVGPGCRDD